MLLVLSVAPLGLIGVVASLLLAQKPMGFVAMLGVLALVSMIARNSVILIDQIVDRDCSRAPSLGRRPGQQDMEKLLGAKSPYKAFEVRTEYAKAAYESYVNHTTKLGQLYTDLARETLKSWQDFAAKVTPVR